MTKNSERTESQTAITKARTPAEQRHSRQFEEAYYAWLGDADNTPEALADFYRHNLQRIYGH